VNIDWKRFEKDQIYQATILIDNPSYCNRAKLLNNNAKFVLRRFPEYVLRMIDPSDETYFFACINKLELLSIIHKSFSDEFYIRIIKRNANAFKYIRNPSHKVCKFAVTIQPTLIRFIEKQTFELQMRAIKKNPFSIQYCRNPNRKLKWMAIHKNPLTIFHITNRSQTMVLVAVQLSRQRFKSTEIIDHLPDKFVLAHQYYKLLTS